MSHTRLSVAERIRFKYWLWWKYGGECAYCHKGFDWRYGLTIDHIQPISKGGAVRDVRNMALACAGCNQAKGNAWDEAETVYTEPAEGAEIEVQKSFEILGWKYITSDFSD